MAPKEAHRVRVLHCGIVRSSVVEYEEGREALGTLCTWAGIRMSDKKGVEGCCKDWGKAGAELQRLVLGEEVW